MLLFEDLQSNAKKTLKLDVLRGVVEGPIVAGSQTLALMILIKGSLGNASGETADLLQAVLFGSVFVGMAGSLFYLYIGARFGVGKNWLMGLPTLGTSLAVFTSIYFYGNSFFYSLLRNRIFFHGIEITNFDVNLS